MLCRFFCNIGLSWFPGKKSGIIKVKDKELKIHRYWLPGRLLCSIRSNRKWCKRRGSSLECQNCFFVYPIIDSNLINFTYLDNGNVNFPDNKKYSRSKPTIIRIPPTTLMPIRLTLLFFIILFAKTNSSAPTTIIKTDINGYMSFLLSNSDLLLNFVFKLYHKTCEQFYRNFGLYEKSPNSFLPGLPRLIVNQFDFHNFLCLCLASVHLPHPFHLVFSFQLLGHAVLLCQ